MFKAFPLTFGGLYGFNVGLQGLPYLSFIVTTFVSLVMYLAFTKYHTMPRYARALAGKLNTVMCLEELSLSYEVSHLLLTPFADAFAIYVIAVLR